MTKEQVAIILEEIEKLQENITRSFDRFNEEIKKYEEPI